MVLRAARNVLADLPHSLRCLSFCTPFNETFPSSFPFLQFSPPHHRITAPPHHRTTAQIFLGAATLLQVAFLCVGFKKLYGKKSPGSEAKAVALIALAFADFVWALCCFVSCIMTKKQSTFWGGDAGCDGQGYYSTLACFSTMFLTMQITHITHTQVSEGAAALPTRGRMVLSSVSIYAFAMLLSAIPFLPSTGGFVYTAEGFCFIDYYDQAINTVFLLSMLVSMSHVWYVDFERGLLLFLLFLLFLPFIYIYISCVDSKKLLGLPRGSAGNGCLCRLC